jgi:hypothetical protein
MTCDGSGGGLKQLRRLFKLGAVGTMTDAQLLDWFISRRDEAAEAAFEELIIRHGPMVLDVCRRVLHDEHDAEDGFQATFLVLADRARSIVRRGSVGSWLFGVAYRISARARARAARSLPSLKSVRGQIRYCIRLRKSAARSLCSTFGVSVSFPAFGSWRLWAGSPESTSRAARSS